MGNCDSAANVYQSSFPLISTITGAAYAVLSPFAFCLNALLMASFIATKQVYLNTTNFLIMCLCLSDLLNGALTLPLLAYGLLNDPSTNNCSAVMFGQVAGIFLPFLSGIITLLIAIDRYLNMNPNLDRRSRCYKVFQIPYVYFLLAFLAISALPISLFIRFMFYIKVVESRHLALATLGSVLFLALGTSFISALYIKGYLRIRKFTEASPIYRERNGKAVRPKYVRNLYRSVFVLVILMWLIYVPMCATYIVISAYTFTGVPVEHFAVYLCYIIVGLLMFLNCVINSCVIFWFNKTAKQWVLSKIQCNLRRRTDNVNDVVVIHSDKQKPIGFTETNL